MKINIRSFLPVFGAVLLSLLIISDRVNASENPWSKYGFQIGGLLSSNDSNVRFGAGAGVEVNFEDALGLDVTTSSFRFDSYWRYTENLRHKLDFSWYTIRRSGEKTVENEFTIENPTDPEGPPIFIKAGAKAHSFMDIDIYKVDYCYSFFQDDRIDLALKLGLFIMPISSGFTATGLVNERADAKFTAPLPAAGFQFDIAITPKWFFRTGTQIFYLKYNDFKGTLYQGITAFEYNAWKNVGIGVGAEMFRLSLEAKGKDYPGVDLRGAVKMNYLSAMLYVKAYF